MNNNDSHEWTDRIVCATVTAACAMTRKVRAWFDVIESAIGVTDALVLAIAAQ